jgi:capsular exopolysaccharide synthesis family protein
MRVILSQPVLGVIPQFALSSEQTDAPGPVELLSLHDPRGFLAESYKSTRTNLEFLRRHRDAQVLLISSPNPGDGKTTTASNLAISMASAGRRVLLIDGDLRKPSLHEPYDLDPHRGLAQVLGDRVPVLEVIQPSAIEHLDVITAGGPVPNPAERLASRRLGEILTELRPLYDLIIIDSSPLLAVTDPSILSASADALLLVTRIGQCQRQDAERALELTSTLGIPLLGAVVNGVTRAHVGRYDRYASTYTTFSQPYGAPIAVPALDPPAPGGVMGTSTSVDFENASG